MGLAHLVDDAVRLVLDLAGSGDVALLDQLVHLCLLYTSYVVAAGGLAAGLVQLTGEEDDKPSLSQLAARMLRTGRKAHIALGAELALGPALGLSLIHIFVW